VDLLRRLLASDRRSDPASPRGDAMTIGIRDQVRALLVEQLGVDEAEATDAATIFDLEIPDEAAEQALSNGTVGDLIAYVEQAVAQRSAV
jgi:acyl carrier protein